MRGTEVPQPRVRFALEAFFKRACEPRFADARVAGDDNDAACTAQSVSPETHQQPDFLLPPNQPGQLRLTQRLEPALDRTGADDLPDWHSGFEAFQDHWSEVTILEHAACKLPRAR